MAWDFNGSTDCLYFSSFTDITDVPHSASVWFRTDSNTADQGLYRLGVSGSGAPQYRQLYLGASTDAMRFDVNGAPGGIDVDTTNTVTDGNWHHWGAMTTETDPVEGDLHQAILDGDWANRGESLSFKNVNAGIDQLSIGAHYTGSVLNPWNGAIAEVAFWNVQLVQWEFEALADGYSPLLIRPQSLLVYMPLQSISDDIIGKRTPTAAGTPAATTDHPKVIMPGNGQRIFTSSGGAPAASRQFLTLLGVG